ncbi:MAG: hypothetical protein FWB86_05390 [Treponema sp.]|nr:hypothetical protein [Treponema sp.]
MCIFLSVSAIYAQEDTDNHEELSEDAPLKTADEIIVRNFWFGIGGDSAMYIVSGLAFGGSFSFGFGSGITIGFKMSWFFNEEDIDTLEINVLLRFYLLKPGDRGPFLQLSGGPSLYNHKGEFSIPSGSGTINGGMSFGWRFVFKNRLFVEPSIRGGYPYLIGANVSAGVCL